MGQEFCVIVNIVEADFSTSLIRFDSVSISITFKGYVEKHWRVIGRRLVSEGPVNRLCGSEP